jgi:hypothetical protein
MVAGAEAPAPVSGGTERMNRSHLLIDPYPWAAPYEELRLKK